MASTKRELTCIVCPRGCQLVAEIEDGKLISVSGNICKRGQTYAEDECTHPKRVVTSTVRCKSGKVVAVKTLGTVPKEKIFEVMAEINAAVAPDTISIGDVIIENVSGTGVAVVATANS